MYLDKAFGVDISPTTPRNYFVLVPNRLPSLFAKRPEITRGSSVRCFFLFCFRHILVSGAAWRQPLVSCAPCDFRLTFRVSSFKSNNVASITANRLNFTVVELDSVYLWHLWPLCLKWISVSVGTDPPCCFRTESCFVFSP